jgi:N utilization substance protein B
MTTRRRAREIVLQVLFEEDLHPMRDEAVAEDFLARRLLRDPALVEFARSVWKGVRERRAEIDKRIGRHSANWAIKRMATIDRNVLRIATWEMIYGGVPGPVAINEAIDIARRYGSLHSGQFVNGILDRVLKEDAAEAGQTQANVLS